MSKTGVGFVTAALKEIQVLDPTATASGERLTDGLDAATDLLDTWRIERLLISGVTISQYSLVSGTQTYTLGTGGVFNQTYPTSIETWSVIPSRTATDPIEMPMGRPYTDEAWQLIAVKSLSGRPRVLYFDRAWVAGLGTCSFYPKPDSSDYAVKLYTRVPAITSLVAATTYNLQPGAQRALTLNLAVELFGRYGKAATMTESLIARAAQALGALKRSNIVPKPSPMRPEYVIGGQAGRRTYNIRTDFE